MHFLIDYENRQDGAFECASCLTPEDSVYIFYSRNCVKMHKRIFDTLADSGCKISLFGLEGHHKNGNDFHIASKVAEIFASENDAEVAIISSDTDFKSVKDYWESYAENKRSLIIAEDIGAAILQTKGRGMQKVEINKYRRRICFPDEFEKIWNGTEWKLKSFLDEERVSKLMELDGKTPREIYLGCLKICGRADGLKAYHIFKEGSSCQT